MEKFLQLLFSGISLGAVYALLALGFVVIFKATEVVNFAHGGLLVVGAWFISWFRVERDWSFWLALVAGVVITAMLAWLVQRVLVRSMGGRSIIAVGIMTIGVDVVLQTEIIRRIGVDVLTLADPWQSRTVDVFGITVPQTRVAAVVVGVGLLVGFFAWFKWSDWGVAMRASAEDTETAALMGIRLGRVSSVAWVIAGALAATAGVFLTAFPAAGLETTTGAVALRAFPAAILGGLDSTGGAIVGGLVIGVAEVLTQGYQNDLTFLGEGFYTVMPYVVMVVVLLIRPTGLFGTKEAARV